MSPPTTSAPLPGVYFETVPEPPADVLPRMDIAAFVGFASAGPVDTPVPVEDLDRFREIFGTDPALAWDAAKGSILHAHLGPTVETFFRNGGRRCWVVRVAAAPLRHRFEVPGLVAADDGAAAVALARSPGSWADDLRVGTSQDRRRLPLAAGAATGGLVAAVGDYAVDLGVAPAELVAGELLEVAWPELGLRLLLFVDEVVQVDGLTRAHGTAGHWLEEVATVSPASPPDPAPGPAVEEVLLAEADGLAAWVAASASPAITPRVHRLRFTLAAWRTGGVAAAALDDGSWQLVGRLHGLAFHPDHPRFWGRLPTDTALFELPRGQGDPPLAPAVKALLAEAAEPRFPLAAEAGQDEPFLPLGMPEELTTEATLGPLDSLDETPLERDGLAEFSAGLFVDPDLAWASGRALAQETEHKLYQRGEALVGLHSLWPLDEVSLIAAPDAVHAGWTRERPPRPAPLGAPSLLSVGEPLDGRFTVTWSAVPAATVYHLEQATAADFADARRVAATADTDAEVSLTDPCPRRLWFRVRAGSGEPGPTSGASEAGLELGPWSNSLTAVLPPSAFADCAEVLLPGFILSHQPTSPNTGGQLDWQSDPALPGTVPAGGFEVQSSTSPGFAAVTAEVATPAPPHDLAPAGIYVYYRVRSVDGDHFGPWSNTVAVAPSSLGDWSLEAAASPAPELLAVQRALLRFCFSRRDLLAVLSAPVHYRRDDLVDHLRQLEPGAHVSGTATAGVVRPLRLAERPALGFGAFYHPWITTLPEQRARSGETLALTTAPPDGTVAGSMAALALNDGAWIAPANRSLEGIFALVPNLDRDDRPTLLERRVNLLVQEPRGFFVWKSDTLTDDRELEPVSVRRFLILLRRLALREGATYVFEPNRRELWGRVRHRFERVLSDLHVRGALAGRTAAEGFRVVVDESVNTPRTLDRGQFLVELRVAPSRPMEFLTIRLVQDGTERLSVQEI